MFKDLLFVISLMFIFDQPKGFIFKSCLCISTSVSISYFSSYRSALSVVLYNEHIHQLRRYDLFFKQLKQHKVKTHTFSADAQKTCAIGHIFLYLLNPPTKIAFIPLFLDNRSPPICSFLTHLYKNMCKKSKSKCIYIKGVVRSSKSQAINIEIGLRMYNSQVIYIKKQIRLLLSEK